MWCKFFVSIFHHLVIFYQRKHQCFLALAGLLIYLKSCDRFSFFLVFVQDRFDPHDGVQNIRSCVSLKGSKSVYIEDIIFGSLIGQIPVLDCSHTYRFRSVLRFLFLYSTVVCDLLVHFLLNLSDQILQTHNTTFSCLKWFAVFSIHGTET